MNREVHNFLPFPIRWGWLLLGCVCLLSGRMSALETVTLTWDRNNETNIAGYKIYYRTSSHTYSNVMDVGNNISWSIPNLIENATYYFAVTAYDDLGIESEFSTEVSHAFFKIQAVSRNLDGTSTITWASKPLGLYWILYKDDLNQSTWTVLTGLITARGTTTSWVDTTAGSTTTRFYKIERLGL